MNDVDSSVYNLPLYKLVGDKIQFQEDIDMNNKKIVNLANTIQSYFIRLEAGQNTFQVNGLRYFVLPAGQVKVIKTKIRLQATRDYYLPIRLVLRKYNVDGTTHDAINNNGLKYFNQKTQISDGTESIIITNVLCSLHFNFTFQSLETAMISSYDTNGCFEIEFNSNNIPPPTPVTNTSPIRTITGTYNRDNSDVRFTASSSNFTIRYVTVAAEGGSSIYRIEIYSVNDERAAYRNNYVFFDIKEIITNNVFYIRIVTPYLKNTITVAYIQN